MPMWRCPHCGTPQAETARCWVCHRSSTACATCQHFRRSVAAQLGYCGLDRERRPLRGDEIRACWEASTVPIEVAPTPGERRMTTPLHVVEDRTPVRKLEFVEVRPTPASSSRRRPPAVESAAGIQTTEFTAEPIDAADTLMTVSPAEARWSFWSDTEV
jgi:hypothetical protein